MISKRKLSDSLLIVFYHVLYILNVFSIKLYSILFYHDIAKNYSEKMCLSMCLELKSLQKVSLVTVQCQTVKSTIQCKRH